MKYLDEYRDEALAKGIVARFIASSPSRGC